MRRLAATALLALALPGAALAADPERPKQWGLDMIGADAAHATATGKGVVVAVLDTGIMAKHRDLASQVLPGHDFISGDDDPNDENGHGSHVSGIIAAASGNGFGVESVAPDARILPVQVLDAGGGGDSATIAKGIDWAVDHGADVINMSLADTVPLRVVDGSRDEMDEAVDRALDSGVIVVAAAGNSSLPVCANPRGGGRLLCVGAVDRSGEKTYYSDYGDGLAITAPGGAGLVFAEDDILSTWNDGGFEYVAGTSQAAPHVSGAAALLRSMGLSAVDTAKTLMATAKDAGPPGADSDYGAGILDAAAAVARAKSNPATTPTPSNSAPRFSIPRGQRIRTVLRHGLRVDCSPSCVVRAVRRGTTIASGSGTKTVRARATKAGRRILRSAKRITLTVRVRLPGAPSQTRRVTLKR